MCRIQERDRVRSMQSVQRPNVSSHLPRSAAGCERLVASVLPLFGRRALHVFTDVPRLHIHSLFRCTLTHSTCIWKGPGFLSLSMNPIPLIWPGSTGPIP